jgi:uncharacterized ferritin-like protein (DUF455 family)
MKDQPLFLPIFSVIKNLQPFINAAYLAWLEPDPTVKCEMVKVLCVEAVATTVQPPAQVFTLAGSTALTQRSSLSDSTFIPPNQPGRPDRPELVDPLSLNSRRVHTPEGLAALIHAVAHIEFNAINLGLDAIWRFADMPDTFYFDWLKVSQEEAIHFTLLTQHLQSLGFTYGDFAAHDRLWEMASRTADDVLARMALVPRTLEARGLDACPAVRHKLLSAGDPTGAAIIDRILQDEIGHVAIGNYWYRWLCEGRKLDPIQTYRTLSKSYRAPKLKAPFNIEARRAAGFNQQELDDLYDKVM